MTETPDPAADTRASYDRVAAEYTRRIADELAGKPLDREWLTRLAALARELGPVADLGCGPGHVTRFLADQGVVAVGLDLSPGMIAEARRLNPDLEFLEGDMRALPWPDATLGGLAALYSILHDGDMAIALHASEPFVQVSKHKFRHAQAQCPCDFTT